MYRSEVLFRHRFGSVPTGARPTGGRVGGRVVDLVKLMGDGVRRGRIDTVAPEHDPVRTGRAPRRDRHGGEVYVYRRVGAPCLVCGTAVATTAHAGRKLYWCPTCQPLCPSRLLS